MFEQVAQFVDALRSNPKFACCDEAIVKNGVVLPLLELLGWAPFNTEEVTPEYTVGTRRVDYALRVNNTCEFFIEAKKPTEDLEKVEHQEQLLDYSFREGVALAGLTNGITWCFYLPTQKGDWQDRKFYTIDVKQQKTADIVEKLISILSKANVVSGEALKSAEVIYGGRHRKRRIEETMPQAWNKMISEPDTLLVDLLIETTERLCGLKPDEVVVRAFLTSHREQLTVTPSRDGRDRSGHPSQTNTEEMTVGPRTEGRASKRGTRRYRKVADYVLPVIGMMRQGTAHTKAFHKQGETLGVLASTVSSQCTRGLGLSTDEFLAHVDRGSILKLLKDRYPHAAQLIGREIGSLW